LVNNVPCGISVSLMYGASGFPTMYLLVSPRMPTSLAPYEWFSSTITATGGGVADRAETGCDVTTARQKTTKIVARITSTLPPSPKRENPTGMRFGRRPP
jgi:hypothetical protein